MPKGRKFPPEFRGVAVRLHRMGGRSLLETTREPSVAPFIRSLLPQLLTRPNLVKQNRQPSASSASLIADAMPTRRHTTGQHA